VTPVSWHPLARRELFEASAYYEGEPEGLGEVFLDEVQQGLEHLKFHPRIGREVLSEVRRFLVSRFPYSIVYRIEKYRRRERIFVLAVAHQKRRPRYWAKRV
jgi:plasmid stabilization system protein ParE